MYLHDASNIVLLSGTLLDVWKMGKAFPVYKEGNRESPLNYRPISISFP